MEFHRVLCMDQFFSLNVFPLGNLLDSMAYISIAMLMILSFLLLNSDKTEVFGPECFREKWSSYIVTLDGISLACSTTVRNFDVIFDQDLSNDGFLELPTFNIVKIRNILSQSDAEKLVHAFVTSRLYDCNSLLLGCPKKISENLPADPKCCSQSSNEI